jgi:hypothetical protein
MIVVHVLTPSSSVLSDVKTYGGCPLNPDDPNVKLINANEINYYILRDMVAKLARLEMPKQKEPALEKLLRSMWSIAEAEGCHDEVLCMDCAKPAKDHQMILERTGGL